MNSSKKNYVGYRITGTLYRVTGYLAAASFIIGASAIDSQGTNIPYILCLAGIIGGVITIALYNASNVYEMRFKIERKKERKAAAKRREYERLLFSGEYTKITA